MKKRSATTVACATLLWGGTAFATPTAQQKCDFMRTAAWSHYASCIDAVVAKDAKGVTFDEFKAFWKCRHAYFKKWTGFQSKASLAGTICAGARFADTGLGTVLDKLTGLSWEAKTNKDGVTNSGDSQDADNTYSLSSGALALGDGTAFSIFLPQANDGHLSGTKDWRLPTLAELQTIMLDFACTGTGGSATCECSGPCVDPALSAGNTYSEYYWSSTSWLPFFPNVNQVWTVFFNTGGVVNLGATNSFYVRAVRNGRVIAAMGIPD